MPTRRRALGVGGLTAVAVLAAWLLWRTESHGTEPGAPGERSSDSAPDLPELRGPAATAGAGRSETARRLELRVTSECEGTPLADAVCGWGTIGVGDEGHRMEETLAGPSGADGRLTLVVPVPAVPDARAREGTALLVSAPGHEARPLGALSSERPDVVAVSLAKVTRIVGEMTWPAGWAGHVRARMVSVGAAPADEQAPWTARSITLAEDGRSFHGVVRGCGRFRVIFAYVLDDAEAGAITTVEIDARTGPEIRVAMQPSAQARQPSTERLHRWTIRVTDEHGTPLAGATVNAMRRYAGHSGTIPGTWETNADGDAVREVAAAKYWFTVSKEGWGTAFAASTIEGERRDVVRLSRATTRLVVRLTQAPAGAPDVVFVELRQRAPPGDPWSWHPLERRGSAQPSARFEFGVVPGQEYALFASGRGLAPVAERVERIGAEEHERTHDLRVGSGTTAEVRGLDAAPTSAPVGVQIRHEGLLGEILTATAAARFTEGRWLLEHLSDAAGEATADVGGRRLRGSLPAAGEGPRVLDLR